MSKEFGRFSLSRREFGKLTGAAAAGASLNMFPAFARMAFAAETADHVAHARSKLQDKGVDAIFANDIGNMGSAEAGGWWINRQSTETIERRPKEQLAEALIQSIRELDA